MSSKSKLQFRSLINRAPEEVFGWHLRPRMLERIIPPWESLKVIDSEGRPDQLGSKIKVAVKLLGCFSTSVQFEYSEYIPNDRFTIRACCGIIKDYQYQTIVTPQSAHSSEVIDRFQLSLPSFLQPFVHRYVKKRINRILRYKHDMIDHDISMLEKYPFEKPLKILISGAHGLIGKNLGYFLEFIGHDVWHLTRDGEREEKTVYWNQKTGDCDPRSFEGFDCIIHLAGENIVNGRWTKAKKERVLKSRSQGTENLVKVIKGLKNPPQAFISASAVGYYGNRGSKVVDETSGPGKGLFITEVCEQWERPSKELEEKGIRVVHTRFGVVLTSEGGALKKMLTPFKWGMGGRIGKGNQYVSWVAIDDVVGAIYHVIMTPKLKGAVNVVSPNPVPNDILAKKLSERLNRWLGPPLPEFLVRLFMGQKGEELLLTSTRVEPACLAKSGYHFQYPKLSQALEHVI